MLSEFRDLKPEPKGAARVIVAIFKDRKHPTSVRRSAIVGLGKLPGAASLAEEVIRKELPEQKEELIVRAMVDTLSRFPRLEPQTLRTLERLRAETGVRGIRVMIDDILKAHP